MKFDIVSDMHIDAWAMTTQLYDPRLKRWTGEPYQSDFIHYDWSFFKNADSSVLVIAGDTSNSIQATAELVDQAATEYDHVVFVDGNHEHYVTSASVSANMSEFASRYANNDKVTYLDGSSSIVIDGVMFTGATGWYDWRAFETRGVSYEQAVQAWKSYSNDSRIPNYADLESPERLAMIQAVQLAETVRAANEDDSIRAIVMVTHMSPDPELMEWKPTNHNWNCLTPSYVNTALKSVLDADSNQKIKYWVYGHTHTQKATEINGVKYINNARGYPRENDSFSVRQEDV